MRVGKKNLAHERVWVTRSGVAAGDRVGRPTRRGRLVDRCLAGRVEIGNKG